jgi:adenylate cyclase
MLLSELRDSIKEETEALVSDDFVPISTETQFVPAIDGPDITYPNLVTTIQRVKLLASCVMYVDLRESTRISSENTDYRVAAIYSAYVRAMTRCANHYGGKVRNIIGDRVMVVFDRENCFRNAIRTAILMNSVSEYLLNWSIDFESIRCGIGIDFGEMLVTKTGIIKQGVETTSNKSLVWLGRPANVASKLTDVANKRQDPGMSTVQVGFDLTGSYNWIWQDENLDQFVRNLSVVYPRQIRYNHPNFAAFTGPWPRYESTNPPILMTQEVLTGAETVFQEK